jgi:hypothetical protein
MARKSSGVSGKQETKNEKFVRLAEQRMGSALKYINLVGNLSGPGYEATDGQKTVILTALQEAVDTVKERFEGTPQKAAGFHLPKE